MKLDTVNVNTDFTCLTARCSPDATLVKSEHMWVPALPPFVCARLQYLADIFGWYPDDQSEEAEEFTYHEVRGKLSDGHYTLTPGDHISPINIWIASDDNCNRSLYIGGSSCWICPDNHYLFFDAIDPTLLPVIIPMVLQIEKTRVLQRVVGI